MAQMTDKEFDALFAHYDTDGNGKVDLKELTALLKALFPKTTDGEIKASAEVSYPMRFG